MYKTKEIMKIIDLKSIIEKQNLDMKVVAKQLFPDNKYPRLALNRVIQGKAVLDANQISKLSLLADIPISKLFSGDGWKEKVEDDIHVFTNGDFRAELSIKSKTTKVFHKDSLFHEEVLHSESIPLHEYISSLNQIINKYETSRDQSID